MSTSTIAAPASTIVTDRPFRPELNGLDRCDSCGAQAYVAAEIGGSELLFCAHHATQFEPKIRAVASSWHDERSKLHS